MFFVFRSVFESHISNETNSLTINHFHCFGDLTPSYSTFSSSNGKFSPVIINYQNQSVNCSHLCFSNRTSLRYECILCLNSLFYKSYKDNDLFLIKNGLRFISDAQNPRYLLQTVNYQWNISSEINNFQEWRLLYEDLKTNFIQKFYLKVFTDMSFWWSSELFSTYTIMEQLEQDKYLLTGIKFIMTWIFLVLFTGVLGISVTLTTLFNFVTCIGILTLLNYKLTVENASYFVVVLIICSQYSVLYSIRYVDLDRKLTISMIS